MIVSVYFSKDKAYIAKVAQAMAAELNISPSVLFTRAIEAYCRKAITEQSIPTIKGSTLITTKLDNGRVFLHNGDYSGDLLINCTPSEVEHLDFPDFGPLVRVTIPFADIKAIVAKAEE